MTRMLVPIFFRPSFPFNGEYCPQNHLKKFDRQSSLWNAYPPLSTSALPPPQVGLGRSMTWLDQLKDYLSREPDGGYQLVSSQLVADLKEVSAIFQHNSRQDCLLFILSPDEYYLCVKSRGVSGTCPAPSECHVRTPPSESQSVQNKIFLTCKCLYNDSPNWKNPPYPKSYRIGQHVYYDYHFPNGENQNRPL